jgi:hypothetical protein
MTTFAFMLLERMVLLNSFKLQYFPKITSNLLCEKKKKRYYYALFYGAIYIIQISFNFLGIFTDVYVNWPTSTLLFMVI